MCDIEGTDRQVTPEFRTVPVTEAVGMVIPHDITEILPGEFKGRAFRKGHVVTEEDISHLQRIGKENLYLLTIRDDEMHEDEAAYALAGALAGEGVKIAGEPKEGKINLIALRDGLLKVDPEALTRFNMLGEVMCSTVHTNTVVTKGKVVAGTRAIPLVVNRSVVSEAVEIARQKNGLVSVAEMRKPRAGVVITGNEVASGKVQDAFQDVITKKITGLGGGIIGVRFAPDSVEKIQEGIRELLAAGADLIVTTGGMSVDPDDVTRFAIKKLGARDITYGSPVLPGAMFMVAYLSRKQGWGGLVPVLGVPACGMYSRITVFDLVLPRVLAGEKIGRKELAELGHGGLCMKCDECRYPVCPFGK